MLFVSTYISNNKLYMCNIYLGGKKQKTILKFKHYDIQRIYERKRLRSKNKVLGRFFASRAIWPFSYLGHVQSCFQRVERRLRISNRTGIGA